MDTTRFTRIGTRATFNTDFCAYEPRTRFIFNAYIYIPQHRIVRFMNPACTPQNSEMVRVMNLARTRQHNNAYDATPYRVPTTHPSAYTPLPQQVC